MGSFVLVDGLERTECCTEVFPSLDSAVFDACCLSTSSVPPSETAEEGNEEKVVDGGVGLSNDGDCSKFGVVS